MSLEESFTVEAEQPPAEESFTAEPEQQPVEESVAIEPEQLTIGEGFTTEPEQTTTVDELPGNAFVETYREAFAEALTEEQELQDNTNEQENKESKGEDGKMDSYGYVSREALDETGIITAGMRIHGDIESDGSVDVIGVVEGNIDVLGKLNITGHINGNSKAAEVYAEGAKINGEVISEGAVKIGDSSVIIGNITAKSAAIAGAVKGDIDVQGPVVLDASAIVMGNIKSKSVQINNGAVIEGMCSQCYADVSPTSFFDSYKTEIKNNKKNKDNNKDNKDNKDNKNNDGNNGK
ncbi:MAG: polymer-forming cytoskeletal protein [Acetatifactor sp.]|nr:polymer-forming cytoskeletal protein [Acetatifactor sp.]